MIKLSKMTDYAVVILAGMARHPGKKLSAAELAASTHLPEPTVAKILKTLARKGVITSERGAQGGYILPLPAENVKIINVIEAMDGPIAMTACVKEEGAGECCDHEKTCQMKGKWNPVNAAIIGALQNLTLADMLGAQ